MLLIQNNTSEAWYNLNSVVNPMRQKDDVVIAIDPSKTNMALIVGSRSGDIYDKFEFSGNNRKRGPVMDTTEYCNEVRHFLRNYLGDSRIHTVAIEAAISKKGMNHHNSSMTLTEIRGTMLNFFLEEYGIQVKEINNWSWKRAILPEGYRSQSEKGSKRFIRDYYPDSDLNNYFEADMTDVFCIFQYVINTYCKSYTITCNKEEVSFNKYQTLLLPAHLADALPSKSTFRYNPNFSVKSNAAYYSNRTRMVGASSLVPVEQLTLDEIYQHSKSFLSPEQNEVRLVIL